MRCSYDKHTMREILDLLQLHRRRFETRNGLESESSGKGPETSEETAKGQTSPGQYMGAQDPLELLPTWDSPIVLTHVLCISMVH
jgi:hypothetical protein